MIRHEPTPQRRPKKVDLDHKKRQFAAPSFSKNEYPHRLNFYELPPTSEISLEQFEQWAIDRLRILLELEACSFRNKTPAETQAHISPLLLRWLPLQSNTSSPAGSRDDTLRQQRRKDHYSHFILRLAFASTEDLRRRYARAETALFKIRFLHDDMRERQSFVQSLNLDWEIVSEAERREVSVQMMQSIPGGKKNDLEQGDWFKIDFERVIDLVETRRIFLRSGKAYVPAREQTSMVLSSFSSNLEKGLELAARALPRLDEDDRLTPILNHLSKNSLTPDSTLSDSDSALKGAHMDAAAIDALATHFPLCMRSLHMTLRKNNHLKHFGRLQYTLFLKGIGLSLDECLTFWRQSFKLITDDTFNKQYRYNVRHAYGDVGGDANRTGRGYAPYSCQKILTEHPPGVGETHGCPYRHYSIENLINLLQSTGVSDHDVLSEIRDDVEKRRYHIACNRVFESTHQSELRKVKDDPSWPAAQLDTIVHPNTYFKRSYMLSNRTTADHDETRNSSFEQ